MKQYLATIAIINGHPDFKGDILGPDVTLPEELVPVYENFYFGRPPIGTATILRLGDAVLAYIDVDRALNANWYAVVGGTTQERIGNLIKRWSVTGVSTTKYPCDPTVPPLREFPSVALWR